MVEASIAVAWDSRSPLEAAVRDSTADRGPSLQYANDFSRCKELLLFHYFCSGCLKISFLTKKCLYIGTNTH